MDALEAFSGKFLNYLSDRALENRIPLSGTFELLPFCNMRCKMCYIVHENTAQYRKELKDVDYWEALIDEAIDAGMLYALITGGEPFLYPGIRELLERINKKPIHLAINTNGTLLNRETVEWLSKVYPGRINISLYGGSNETYARLCGNPKGFDQVITAFDLLTEYGIPFRVHASMTPDNMDDMDKMIDICNKYRAPLHMVHYMFPPYRKDQGLIDNDGRLTPVQAAEVVFRILKSKNRKNYDLMRQLEVYCEAFERPEIYSLYGKKQVMCRGGCASFWINWRGQVSGCGIYDGEKIDLSVTSFAEAWKQIVENTENIVLSEKCAYCPYRSICSVCAAAAYCETGDIAGAPDYLCRMCEVYAQMLKEEYQKLRDEYERGLF